LMGPTPSTDNAQRFIWYRDRPPPSWLGSYLLSRNLWVR
jgi:hypothetical protein